MVETKLLPELQLKGEGFVQPAELPTNLRIYGHHGCPYVERVKLTLYLKKIPFQFVAIDLPSRPPWYMNLPSAGRIPVLELPKRSAYLYESLSVAQYIDETEDGAIKLMPQGKENALLRAKIRAVMGRADDMTTNFYKAVKSFGEDKDGLELLRKSYVSFDQTLAENVRGKANPFFIDQEKPTFADVALFPHTRRLMIFEGTELCDGIFKTVNLKSLPNLMKWYNAMIGIKEVAENTVKQELFMSFLKRYKETKQFLFTLP